MVRIVSVVITALVSLLPAWTPRSASAAPMDVEVGILLSALQLADEARYSVALARPRGVSLTDVRVEVTLPPDAELSGARETPGRTMFRGVEGTTLGWTAPSFAAGQDTDAFSFGLSRATAGTFHIDARWRGDQPGERSVDVQPQILDATANAGELTVGAAGTTGYVAVGRAGVWLHVPSDTVPEGTQLRVQRLGAEADPPAALGNFWWCALVDVAGLPAGAHVDLLVPARQALPAQKQITLFSRHDGAWQETAEPGVSSADGQFVALTFRGDPIAAGTGTAFAPASANPMIRVSGQTTLGPFSGGLHYFSRVTNAGTTTLGNIMIEVSEPGLPLDFQSVTSSNTSIHCEVLQHLAILGANILCSGTLIVSGFVDIDVFGFTTFVPGFGAGFMMTKAWRNFSSFDVGPDARALLPVLVTH